MDTSAIHISSLNALTIILNKRTTQICLPSFDLAGIDSFVCTENSRLSGPHHQLLFIRNSKQIACKAVLMKDMGKLR